MVAAAFIPGIYGAESLGVRQSSDGLSLQSEKGSGSSQHLIIGRLFGASRGSLQLIPISQHMKKTLNKVTSDMVSFELHRKRRRKSAIQDVISDSAGEISTYKYSGTALSQSQKGKNSSLEIY